MMSETTEDLARSLILAVEQELVLGTKHYNAAGDLLETVKEIVDCLLDEGSVTLEPTPERKHLFEKPV